jgi:tetratricopeptide (TPR) repeat protein
MAKASKAAPHAGPPSWLWPAILLAAALVYLPAMSGPFIFDDLTADSLNPAGSPPVLTLMKSSRPLFYLSLWLDRQLFGLSPMPMHLVNLLLHLLNACLIVGVVKRILAMAGVESNRRDWLAVAAGGVFALHPVLTEAVSYIVSRSEALSLFFALAALRVFLGAESIGLGRALATLLFTALAALAKEHSFALVPLMLLTAVWFGGSVWQGLKAKALVIAPLIVGGFAGAIYVFKAVGTQATAGFGVQAVTPINYLATQCTVIWRYVFMFFLPWGMNIDHAIPFAKSFAEPSAIAGALALLAGAAAAVFWRKTHPLAGFGWLAFLILLAPTSSIVPIADAMTDRRLYLSSLGLLVFASEWFRRGRSPGRGEAAGLAAVLVVLGALGWNRNQDYTSAERLWRASIASNPANARAHFQLAHALYSQGECAESAASYEKAYSLGQQGADLLVDWALALDCASQSNAAIEKLRAALAQESRNYHTHATLGMVLAKQGRLEDALAELNQAIELNKRFDMSWTYRGNVLFLLGRRNEAASDFRQALALNPENPAAQKGLAAAMARE